MTTETTLLEPGLEAPRLGFYLLAMSRDSFVTHPIRIGDVVTIGRTGAASLRLDDRLCSRMHAKICIAETITVEDLGSANGTKVRGVRIEPHQPTPISAAEAFQVGGTSLMVQRDSTELGSRRMWSHNYFESRLAQECEKAARTRTNPATLRIRLEATAAWDEVMPILVAELAPPHLLAVYGPAEYEALLLDLSEKQAAAVMATLQLGLAKVKPGVRLGLASFPRDGRNANGLIGHASQQVRPAVAFEASAEPRSRALDEVYSVAERAAQSNINILILGETGVGKEVMTKFIHRLSARSARELVCINCAGFQESLLESELFGYERGAFTGANQAKPGILETADGGTVLLDEVGEMPLQSQAKLLRVLEARQVMRVGAIKPRAIDVRFIAATNRDLEQEVAEGRFREDLFFRLNGISLYVPPLRERTDEIEVLARQFVLDAGRSSPNTAAPKIAPAVLDLLRSYYWPGNIRELKNVMERALVLCTGPEITTEHVASERMRLSRPPAPIAGGGRTERVTPVIAASDPEATKTAAPSQALGEAQLREREEIIQALQQCAWNQTRVAQLLGMPRRTLVFKLRAYDIPRPHQKPAEPSSSDPAARGGNDTLG